LGESLRVAGYNTPPLPVNGHIGTRKGEIVIEYKIQTRKKNRKYETRVIVMDNFVRAKLLYGGYNIGRGYAKRLLENGVVIAKYSDIR
jgi:hypothetical protein